MNTQHEKDITVFVVGAGSWGTTLAVHCSWMGHRVTLWEKFEETAHQIVRYRENRTYLPGVEIPADLHVTTDMTALREGFDIVLFVVPSQYIRSTAQEVSRHLMHPAVVSSATKGLERKTLHRISEVLAEELDRGLTGDIVILSGPSHAEEVSRKLPTTIVSASKDRKKAEYMQQIMTSTHLRVYTNDDVVGVELGGALKNIIAIANGICAGLGYGDNTTGALITRGIAEISRLGVVMGAEPMTFSGLSGIGDLITTCVSGHSRNRHVGVELAKGKKLADIVEEMVMVAEGIETTRAAVELSRRYDIEMPITDQVYQVLFENKSPKEAVDDLMLREPKPELETPGRQP